MKKLISRAGRAVHLVMSAHDKRRFSKYRREFKPDLSFTEAVRQFPSRNLIYAYLHHYFFHNLPSALATHRDYFSRDGRGFGEQAFHPMWYLLLREFTPKSFLEIGVFRGQVVSLWALIGKLLAIDVEVHCISPFSAAGDRITGYPPMDFLADVLHNFREFNLTEPTYLRALSTDASAIAYMQTRKFDCIYIDGSHDHETVLSDYRNSVAALNPGGILVMDDSSLYTDFAPPAFSFAGHPGPSKVARDFADRELVFIAGVGHQNVYRKI